MDSYNARQQPVQRLSHRISNLSEVIDYETYEGYQVQSTSPPSSSLRGRESLVSLQSSFDPSQQAQPIYASPASASPGSSAWSNPFSSYGGSGGVTAAGRTGSGGGGGGGGSYEPVPASGGGGGGHGPTHQRSRNFPRMASIRQAHDTISEEPEGIRESIDMTTLVRHGAPMGSSKVYSPVPKDDVDEEPGMPFDVTGFMGPATSQDEAFIKRLQEDEASGKLTGGLGVGFGNGMKVRESELLATSPISERGSGGGLARSFTRRMSLGRQGTVKALAQSEANKRGEIVEVIMDEPSNNNHNNNNVVTSEVDLSVVVGPATPTFHEGMRRTTLPQTAGSQQQQQQQRTEVFYPQPDWKPFSMRWPYLLGLIVLSIGLGGTQEVIYQISSRGPLLQFQTPSQIPGVQYFAFKFLPTIISVSFGVLWQITDFEVKRLEAFYQLSKERGALADESINVDYVTFFSFIRPFRALYCKHYAVATSSVASLLAVSLVPTLGTACIVLHPDRNTRAQHPLGDKFISIDAVWSRLLTATLFIIAFLGCVLFYQLQTRKSGLLADVKGIAGLASMAVVSHILMDFKDMDVATHKDIHHKLRDHRYVLRNSSLAPDDETPVSSQEQERYDRVPNHLSQNPHPLMLRPVGAITFIVGIVAFAGLIPTFLFTPANWLTDKAPWLVTALAVCIKLSWSSLETSVRLMEPFYLLSRRHAPPKTLTLDYTAMPFGWVAIQALLNRHFLVFFVGFGTVMTELLTVLVTALATVEGRAFVSAIQATDDLSFPPAGGNSTSSTTRPSSSSPNNGTSAAAGLPPDAHDINAGQETEASFWMSLGLASFILLYMGVVATAVFVRRRRPFLPRQPNTIASVLAFIHQSKMLYDFVGTSKLSNAGMVTKLESLGKTYGLGWFEGRDGQTHCGVDQEELMSSYKLGYDYSRSNKPWVEVPVEWL